MNVEIAQRLAAKRKEKGYSQEELAQRLGVSRQAVSKWERSESSPDTDNLIALARLYGVSLDDLLYVDETIEEDVVFEASDKASASSENGERSASAAAAAAGGTADAGATQAEAGATGSAGEATQAESGSDSSTADYSAFVHGDTDKVHIGPDGIHVEDGADKVHVSWKEGVHVSDKNGTEVHVGWDGIHVDDPAANTHVHSNEHGRGHGKVTVEGQEFDSLHDAHRAFSHKGPSGALKFPFPLLVILAYILVGIFLDAWAIGLFLFFLIPVYYVLVAAISKRRLAPALAALYPLASIAFFLYMAFFMNMAHPAWVIFLTIPVVEYLIVAPSEWWAGRKRRKRAAADEPITVEPEQDE